MSPQSLAKQAPQPLKQDLSQPLCQQGAVAVHAASPVSYTHLTLPTICSV